jgi:hypothetical protein
MYLESFNDLEGFSDFFRNHAAEVHRKLTAWLGEPPSQLVIQGGLIFSLGVSTMGQTPSTRRRLHCQISSDFRTTVILSLITFLEGYLGPRFESVSYPLTIERP